MKQEWNSLSFSCSNSYVIETFLSQWYWFSGLIEYQLTVYALHF